MTCQRGDTSTNDRLSRRPSFGGQTADIEYGHEDRLFIPKVGLELDVSPDISFSSKIER